MERLADQEAVINQGSLLLSESVEDLLGRFRRVSFTSSEEAGGVENLPPNWLMAQRNGRHVSFTEPRFSQTDSAALLRSRFGEVQDLSLEGLSLKEIYLVLARNLKQTQTASQSR